MNDLLIVVEGDADVCFVLQYIKYLTKQDHVLNERDTFLKVLTNTEGLIDSAKFHPQLTRAMEKGRKVIAILDADFEYTHRLDKLQQMVEGNLLTDFFLLPFNRPREEKDAYTKVYNLETLLINLCHEDHQDINQCHDQYVECLLETGKELQLPDEKIKLYAYSKLLNKRTDGNIDPAHEKSRNYLDQTQWNLNHEALIPLKEFLLKHLSA